MLETTTVVTTEDGGLSVMAQVRRYPKVTCLTPFRNVQPRPTPLSSTLHPPTSTAIAPVNLQVLIELTPRSASPPS